MVGAIALALEKATAPLQSCRFVAYFRAPTTPLGGSGTAAPHSDNTASSSGALILHTETSTAHSLEVVIREKKLLPRVGVVLIGRTILQLETTPLYDRGDVRSRASPEPF